MRERNGERQYLDEMLDLGEELSVDSETAVEGVAGLG